MDHDDQHRGGLQYLREPLVTALQFKQESDGSKWDPDAVFGQVKRDDTESTGV